MVFHLPSRPLKTHSELEPVLRCEPITSSTSAHDIATVSSAGVLLLLPSDFKYLPTYVPTYVPTYLHTYIHRV